MNFQDNEYKELIEDVLYNISNESTSYRTKLALLRHYLEIIVRKLVDYSSSDAMTLNNNETKTRLNNLQETHSITGNYLRKSIRKASEFLNKYSHTQHLLKATENDFIKAQELVTKVISGIFLIHFKKNKFGSNLYDLSAFSILPPMVRFEVLNNLYESEKSNLLIHKYVLSILKYKNKEEAIKFVNKNCEIFKKMQTIPEDGMLPDFLIKGLFLNGKPHFNMYDHLIFAIHDVYKQRSKNEVYVYSSFEQALVTYKRVFSDKDKLESFKEAKELKKLIEFIFIGREIKN